MPSKIRRVQTRMCATHNYIKPDIKVRSNWQAMDKSTATRKEKLSVHRVAKVVNRKWRQTLRKCEIKEINGLWFVQTANNLTQCASMSDAIEHAKG